MNSSESVGITYKTLGLTYVLGRQLAKIQTKRYRRGKNGTTAAYHGSLNVLTGDARCDPCFVENISKIEAEKSITTST